MTGFAAWWSALQQDRRTARLSCFGDSTTEGTGTTNGGWTEQFRVLADTRGDRGGDGVHLMNRDAWTLGGSWTAASFLDAWDRGPFRGAAGSPAANTYHASGSANTATWTKPAGVTARRMRVYVIDGPGANDFSYRVDGGIWTAVPGGTAWTAGNSVKVLDITTTVTSTFDVRAANAAGTAVDVYLVGVEPIGSTLGLTVDNFGAASDYFASLVRTTVGDWRTTITALAPQAMTTMFTNDVLLYGGDGGTAWRAMLDAFATYAVTTLGVGWLPINFWEQDGRDVGTQAAMRADVKACAQTYGVKVLDLYDLTGDYAATYAAGYINGLHPTDAGAVFIAQQVWKMLASARADYKAKV